MTVPITSDLDGYRRFWGAVVVGGAVVGPLLLYWTIRLAIRHEVERATDATLVH